MVQEALDRSITASKAGLGRIVCSVVVLFLISACGGGTSEPVGSTDQLSFDVAVGSTVALRPAESDPLGTYASRSSNDFVALQRGLEAIAIPCMREQGHNLESRVPAAAAARPDFTVDFTLDPDIAARYGYQGEPDPEIPTLDTAPRSESEEVAYYEAMWGREGDPAAQLDLVDETGAVMTTMYRGGCMGRAERAIFGDFGDYESMRQLLERVQNTAVQQTYADPRVGAATERWAECIAEEGYGAFESPVSIVETLDDLSSEYSRALAVADSLCRETSGYAKLANQVFWSYELAWIEQHPEVLTTFTDLWRSALQRAVEVSRGE